MEDEKWKHLARLADILTIMGFIPIFVGILYWVIKKMDWTLFLEICLFAIFIVSLFYSIGYRLNRFRKRINILIKDVETLKSGRSGQVEDHLIEHDPSRKMKDEFFKRILTGSQ